MKLAIITGASSGIGCAAAELFLQSGFAVVNLSRRAHPNPNVESLSVDLCDEAAIATVSQQLLPRIKTADSVALVHNAGYLAGDSADQFDAEILQRSLAVNVVAPSLLNKAWLSAMPASSSVMYIGSTLSEKAVAGSYSYVLSKHAVVGMMRATCQDLFGRELHTACICPGFTDTQMLREHISDEAVMQSIGANNGFGRLVRSEEMAELIVWAHQNPLINGSVLHANLGQKEY